MSPDPTHTAPGGDPGAPAPSDYAADAAADSGTRASSDGSAAPGPREVDPDPNGASFDPPHPSPTGEELGEGSEAEVDPELAALIAKAEKADEYLALAQRTQADFENYRKRTLRDAKLAEVRGVTKLAKELLPAVDNLDRALNAALAATTGDGDEVHGQLVSGMQLVHADVISALQRAGIDGFSPVGEPFDPQWHEAVAHAPVPGADPGSVVEVYQRGYKHGETVLRPARVLVAA